MDKTFVVGFITFSENDLVLEIVQAENSSEALAKHSRVEVDWFDPNKPLNDIQEDLFDQDIVVEVIEIEPS